jgi:hypothetical protein
MAQTAATTVLPTVEAASRSRLVSRRFGVCRLSCVDEPHRHRGVGPNWLVGDPKRVECIEVVAGLGDALQIGQ